MSKIFVVKRIYKDINRGDVKLDYSEVHIDKILDCKEKVIEYIRAAIEKEHKWVDEYDPHGLNFVKYYIPDVINENEDIAAYESYGIFRLFMGCSGVYYNYISMEIE